MVTNEAELTAVLRLRDETAGQWRQFNGNTENAGQRLREMGRSASLAALTVTGLVVGLSRAQLTVERAALEARAEAEQWKPERLRRELAALRDPVKELAGAFGTLAASLQVNEALSQVAGLMRTVSNALSRLDPRLLTAVGQAIVFIAGALTALATALLLVRIAQSPFLGIAALAGFAAVVAANKFGQAGAPAGTAASGAAESAVRGAATDAARSSARAQGGNVITNNILNVPESSLLFVEDTTAFSRMTRSVKANLIMSARLGTVP